MTTSLLLERQSETRRNRRRRFGRNKNIAGRAP